MNPKSVLIQGQQWERRKLKAEINSTQSERIKYLKRQQYKEKDKDAKRMVRSDKREMINNMAKEAEEAAQMNYTGEHITHRLKMLDSR